MRKHTEFAWVLLLALGALVAFKFQWFKEQYIMGGRWAIEGWRWALTHQPIVVAVGVAFVLGVALGWIRSGRRADQALKALSRLTGQYRVLLAECTELTHSNRQLTEENEILRVSEVSHRPAPAPRPAPPPKQKRVSKKKAAEDAKTSREPRLWQERLLDDDLDHIDKAPPQPKETAG